MTLNDLEIVLRHNGKNLKVLKLPVTLNDLHNIFYVDLDFDFMKTSRV